MNKKTHIAFISSECQPYFTSGGLGEVIGSLPKAIMASSRSFTIDVYLPYYRKLIKPEFNNLLTHLNNLLVTLSWRTKETGVFYLKQNNVNYYFIDYGDYFDRDKFYGYDDDAERFAFFSKACIETMLVMDNIPDVIHAHDWQAALSLVYLRTNYYNEPKFVNTKKVFTIHNIEYQGIFGFDNNRLEDLFGISNYDASILEYNGCINLMKGAMESANIVSTVSMSYAEEICDKEYAHGLEAEVLRVKEEGKLTGILNGIDTVFYNSETDKSLFKTFGLETLSDKAVNKKGLQEYVGLPVRSDVPLIGMVSRLVFHKGLSILKSAMDELLTRDIQIVILGTGDKYFEDVFKSYSDRYPEKVKTILAFNGDLSRKIYGGCDLFLMPSMAEPCGLSQMIASRYATISMVRKTGGLKDSIIEFDNLGHGCGYNFEGFDSGELIRMVDRAINDYKKDDFIEKMKLVYNTDFSWKASAKKYIEMYKKLFK